MKRTDTMKRAWEIRRQAALDHNVACKEINFNVCLKLAWNEYYESKKQPVQTKKLSQSVLITEVVLSGYGFSVKEVAEKAGCTPVRVHGHLQYLKKKGTVFAPLEKGRYIAVL